MNGSYVAIFVILIVWIGLFLFLMRLNKRIRKLEEKVE